MPEMVKHALGIIAARWKTIVGVLLYTLIAIGLALLLRKFPSTRIPFAVGAACVFLLLLLWLFPKWQVRAVSGLEAKDRFDRENEARKTLSQILGGLILIIGFYFTWKNLDVAKQNQVDAENANAVVTKATQDNLRIAQEGQITDRFTKATMQLGDPKLEIRLGGIYALERIAKDSPKDHLPIMEVLTAYVREHANLNSSSKSKRPGSGDEGAVLRPPEEIQAILTVIGRRTLRNEQGLNRRLDLHGTDLRGANLFEADLTGLELFQADLRGASLVGANLTAIDLRGADLREADLERASLRGAILSWANLLNANLMAADLSGADLSDADLRGAHLQQAILHGARLSHAQLNWARLYAADLSEAEISGTSIGAAHFDDAILTKADLRYADLHEAKGLSFAQLESTLGDEETKLPKGMQRPKSWQ